VHVYDMNMDSINANLRENSVVRKAMLQKENK
jgi:hypothetical protein